MEKLFCLLEKLMIYLVLIKVCICQKANYAKTAAFLISNVTAFLFV